MDMKEKGSQKNVHEGHRKRMLDRFLQTGNMDNSGIQNHELLEMLLFFSIPRENTNETAHRLISEFGSFRGVMEAPYDALKTVPGIGDKSAALIRLMSAVVHAYIKEPNRTSSVIQLNDARLVVAYLRNLFFGYKQEMLYMLLFNQRGIFLEAVRISEGTVNHLVLDERLAVQTALHKHGSYVVLGHNHPSGNTTVSEEDIATTDTLSSAFSAVGITLLEHYVVTENAHVGIIGKRNLEWNRKIAQIKENGAEAE